MREAAPTLLPEGSQRVSLAGGGSEVICREAALFLDVGGTRLLSMRTPMGEQADRDWALGFLASEGVIEDISEVKSIEFVEGGRLRPPTILLHHRGTNTPRKLPHIDRHDVTQMITFRLADSLPLGVSAKHEEDGIDGALDRGYGECVLQLDSIARIVAETLRINDGKKYDLLAWCVMPNHVHVIVGMRSGFTLAEITEGWKSFSAHAINRELGRKGEFWQSEFFDRYLRDSDHLERSIAYVVNNPVSAGLCAKPEEWKWSWAIGWGKDKCSALLRDGKDKDMVGEVAHPQSSMVGEDAHPPQEIRVELWRPSNVDRLGALARTHEMRASCGLCGVSNAAGLVAGLKPLAVGTPQVSMATIGAMIETLRTNQPLFDATGGCHGVALLDSKGRLLALAEDIGRHNALDRVIGAGLSQGVYFKDCVVVLSGRAGYELVIKAVRVGIPLILSIGAASSFAIEVATAAQATLVGFIRSRHGESPKRAHVYSGADRII